MKTKLMALLLCMVLVCSLMVWKASATETAEYLALGDSISAAYGLKSEKEGFVYLVSKGLGYTVANESVNGNTADGILEKLKTGELDSLIKNVKLITITCGGNDLMNVLYEDVAEVHNRTNGTSYTGRDVIEAFGGIHSDPAMTASVFFTDTMVVLNTFTETEAFKTVS